MEDLAINSSVHLCNKYSYVPDFSPHTGYHVNKRQKPLPSDTDILTKEEGQKTTVIKYVRWWLAQRKKPGKGETVR